MTKFYTFRKQALKNLRPGQVLRFTKGRGYWLFGKVTHPLAFTMYDSTNLREIPAVVEAVAGYVGGHWPTYRATLQNWPRAKHLSIAVASYQDAECLDVEQGDSTNDKAPAWVRRQQSRGIKRPVIYTSVSNVVPLLAELARHGIRRQDIRLWTAHYTHRPHRCTGACGFGMPGIADATQYTNKALGRTLDASLCAPTFL